jgi:hypothetical protein
MPFSGYKLVRSRALMAVAAFLIVCSPVTSAQARSLVNTATRQVNLPNSAGQEVVLSSVSLGQPRTFSMFNVQAAGTVSPDPDLNGASFQLRFLICDQPDCSGDIRTPLRILPDAGASNTAQVIATRSFGVNTHSAQPVVLSNFKPRTSNGSLYLAAALKVLRTGGTTRFTGKLNLLRVDVLP